MKTTHKGFVDEVEYGVYVWRMPNGQWVGDDEGNFLSISAMRHDSNRIRQLVDAVRSYGIEEGRPFFLSGHRKINDEEYEQQLQRAKWGLVPDENDIPALMDELSYRKEHGD